MATTPVDLYAFGNRSGPRPPRLGIDVVPDAAGMVGPEPPPLPRGMSAFASLAQATATGHYYILPQGTELPPGVAVVADGVDVEDEDTGLVTCRFKDRSIVHFRKDFKNVFGVYLVYDIAADGNLCIPTGNA